jgi:hypothetical protein
VRVVRQRPGQFIGLRVALEPQGAPTILGLAHQARLTVCVRLDGNAGQQAAVGVQSYFGQSFRVLRVVATWLGVFALVSVRPHQPQPTVDHGHTLQVGLIVGCAR